MRNQLQICIGVKTISTRTWSAARQPRVLWLVQSKHIFVTLLLPKVHPGPCFNMYHQCRYVVGQNCAKFTKLMVLRGSLGHQDIPHQKIDASLGVSAQQPTSDTCPHIFINSNRFQRTDFSFSVDFPYISFKKTNLLKGPEAYVNNR